MNIKIAKNSKQYNANFLHYFKTYKYTWETINLKHVKPKYLLLAILLANTSPKTHNQIEKPPVTALSHLIQIRNRQTIFQTITRKEN